MPYRARRKVLIIEDDEGVRYSLQAILEHSGCYVMEARDGNEGMARFSEERFDVVFCDIIMPHMDGLMVIEAVRRADPSTFIIAMSGGGRVDKTDYLAAARNLGAQLTLPKPFTSQEVMDAMEAARPKLS